MDPELEDFYNSLKPIKRCIFLPDADYILCFYTEDPNDLQVIPFEKDQLEIVKLHIMNGKIPVISPEFPTMAITYDIKASRIYRK